jgi:hypothetical protein
LTAGALETESWLHPRREGHEFLQLSTGEEEYINNRVTKSEKSYEQLASAYGSVPHSELKLCEEMRQTSSQDTVL